MSLTRNGVTLDCEHCRCTACRGMGEFDIAVPLREPGSGAEGSATLHCTVSPGRHQVTLTAWRDAAGEPVDSGEPTQRRIDATLDFVATHRICGSRHLCPREVVDIVDQVKAR